MIIHYKTSAAELQVSVEASSMQQFFDSLCGMLQEPGRDSSVCISIAPESVDEARGILAHYVDVVKAGKAIPPPLLMYVAHIFEEILAGNRRDKSLAGKALRILHSKRARPTKNRERDWKITEEIIDLMERGESLLSAALTMSEKYSIHESNVQKIYSRYRELVEVNRSF